MVALNPWYLSKSCASIANVLYLVPLTRALYIRATNTSHDLVVDHSCSLTPCIYNRTFVALGIYQHLSASARKGHDDLPHDGCGSQQVLTVVPIYWDAVQPSTVKNLDFWRMQKVYIYILEMCVYILYYIISVISH
jgi:hypothetical protein